MLLAWTIPNTAASIVGGAVSLNLSHAFETAMAGYGLGRIATSQNAAGAESGVPAQAGNSLGASLEAGDKAAPITALGPRQPGPPHLRQVATTPRFSKVRR